jgi:hypothetical protein
MQAYVTEEQVNASVGMVFLVLLVRRKIVFEMDQECIVMVTDLVFPSKNFWVSKACNISIQVRFISVCMKIVVLGMLILGLSVPVRIRIHIILGTRT